jgi:NitT/TauT family transport system ATP-binding protein
MTAKLEVVRVSKDYGTPGAPNLVHALEEVSLAVADGEFVSLLGPSGCGKSTLLHIIAGFEQASGGEVRIDRRVVRGPGADRGMVFQDYALFPWRTVLENVAFGLELRQLARRERLATAREYVHIVGLAGFESKYPHELSGGMRQRCALARCIANDPEVLLMDEPLAAIDALTRHSLQEEILKVCSVRGGTRKTAVYVTHSIEEAVFLSDRIVLMTQRPGRVLKTIEVPFGPTRDDTVRLQSEYQLLCNEIWQTLKDHIQPGNKGRVNNENP